MRATALVLVLSLASCRFAVEHPAATAGIVGATIGVATCEMGTNFDEHATCGLVAGGAALLLGGVVFLATMLGGEGNTVLTQPPDDLPVRPEPPSIDDPQPAPVPAGTTPPGTTPPGTTPITPGTTPTPITPGTTPHGTAPTPTTTAPTPTPTPTTPTPTPTPTTPAA